MTTFQILYDAGPSGLWIFLLVSVFMGGATAFVTGKAIAETWRPIWHALAYAFVTGLAVRFIHFALFQEILLSLRNYIIDCAVLVLVAAAGFIVTRRRQVADQYGVISQSK